MTEEADDLEALRVSTETGDRLDAVNSNDDSPDKETSADDKEQETACETSASDTALETGDDGDSPGLIPADEGTPSEIVRKDHYPSRDGEELETVLDDALDDLEGNDRALHIWDGNLAAVIGVLESKPELKKQVISEIDARTKADVDIDSQSEFLSHLLRVGLEEVAPKAMDALRETKKQRAVRNM
jgi:hypothetical protein